MSITEALGNAKQQSSAIFDSLCRKMQINSKNGKCPFCPTVCLLEIFDIWTIP